GAGARDSARVAAARSGGAEGIRRQREQMRPLAWAFIAAVVISAEQGRPAPGLAGVRLGITAALAVCAVAAAVGLNPRWAERGLAAQAVVIGLLGGGGVALAALQPHGATGLAASLAVLIAAVRLPAWPAPAAMGAVRAALAAAVGLTQPPAAQPAIAVTLFCLLLAVTGRFIRRNWESQDQTELLMAQLQDARDAEAAAAALAERGRIAGELHDVLAHALSGLAIQLQGARKLADAEDASAGLRAAIARSADLAKEGLTQARQAVGAARRPAPVGHPAARARRRLPPRHRHHRQPGNRGSPPAAARRGGPGALPRRPGGADQHRPVCAGRHRGSHRALPARTHHPDRTERRVPTLGRPSGHRPGRGAAGGRGRGARPAGEARPGRAGGRPRPRRPPPRRLAGRAGRAGVTAAGGRPPIRVLIADDQRVVRDGLAMLAGLIDGVEIAGAACDGEEAVRLAVAHRPDVILMDLPMPGMDGIAATAHLRDQLPSARVLVLTTYADDDTILPALRAGAHGYLTKDASAEQIEAAIRAVHAGQTHLDPLVQERLVAAVTG